MSAQPTFDVLGPPRLAQTIVVEQVYLTDRQIVGGAPVPVEQIQIIGVWIKSACMDGSHGDPSGYA